MIRQVREIDCADVGKFAARIFIRGKCFTKIGDSPPLLTQEKGNQTENKLERRPCPGYFNGVGYDRMYWSAYAVHGLAG